MNTCLHSSTSCHSSTVLEYLVLHVLYATIWLSHHHAPQPSPRAPMYYSTVCMSSASPLSYPGATDLIPCGTSPESSAPSDPAPLSPLLHVLGFLFIPPRVRLLRPSHVEVPPNFRLSSTSENEAKRKKKKKNEKRKTGQNKV